MTTPEIPVASLAGGRSLLLRRKSGRASAHSPASTEAPPMVNEVLRSPGQPLDAATRAFMEPRFGYSFADVQIHPDAKAADSADAVNAHAYTVGRHVVFGPGQYAPRSRAGQRLLAHELTHVIQQSGGGEQALQRQPKQEKPKEPDASAPAASTPAPPSGSKRVEAALTLLRDAKKAVMANPDAMDVWRKATAGLKEILSEKVTDWAMLHAFTQATVNDPEEAKKKALNALWTVKRFDSDYLSGLSSWNSKVSWDDMIASVQNAKEELALLLDYHDAKEKPPPPIDNTTTWNYIGHALGQHSNSPLFALMEIEDRRTAFPYDPNLAAADHYLFARFLVEDEHWPRIFVAGLADLYGIAKAMDAVPSFMKDTVPTPNSPEQIKWGVWGAYDAPTDITDINNSPIK